MNRCHFIELDVQMCRDTIPVIMHDPTLVRTSDAQRLSEQLQVKSLHVDKWQLQELRQLDMGSWFLQRDPFNSLTKKLVDRSTLQSQMPQRIITLEEVLQWAKQHNIFLNVEIKDHSQSHFDTIITPCVLDHIEKAIMANRVLVSSFNHDYLRQCKALNQTIATAALEEHNISENLIEYLIELEVDAYHPYLPLVSPNLINTVCAAGLAVNVFTVNDPATQKALFDGGVTAIFTDFPQLTRHNRHPIPQLS